MDALSIGFFMMNMYYILSILYMVRAFCGSGNGFRGNFIGNGAIMPKCLRSTHDK